MKAGWSKEEIQFNCNDIVMMGYAYPENRVKSSATSLFARSVWMNQESSYLLVYLDICFISKNLHDEICSKIVESYPIQFHEIQITASHTHSAPGGYGDKLYYEVPTPGFQQDVFTSYVNAALKSVASAYKDLSDCKAYFGNSDFPSDSKVGMNRSLNSYRANPETDKCENEFQAMNKTMHGLRLVKESGQAFISWFGIHGTSIPQTGTAIHFDNKGYACQLMENNLGRNSVAIFAQSMCGDVTPNYVFDKKINHTRGPFEDFDKNAAFNGELQFRQGLEVIAHSKEVELRFESFKANFLFSNLTSNDSKFKTSSASFGTSFIQGTAEGPGVPLPLVRLLNKMISLNLKFKKFYLKFFNPKEYKTFSELVEVQSPKSIFVSPARREILGLQFPKGVPFISLFDPLVKNLNRLLKKEMYQHQTWYEENLPLQIIDLGAFLILAVPFEITTVSGRRITKTFKELYQKEVIISAYSNAYAGYISTPEEYEHLSYEAGHTVFGKGSLPVLIDTLIQLARKDFDTKTDVR